MKNVKVLLSMVLATLVFTSVDAFARPNWNDNDNWRRGRNNDRWDRDHRRDHDWDHGRGRWRRDHDWDRRPIYAKRGCAPEVTASNLNKVETALNTTASRRDFSDASLLREALAEIQTNSDMHDRIADYLNILGVETPEQVADLMGGEHTAVYVESARQSLDLSREQAQILVDNVTAALRGSLR